MKTPIGSSEVNQRLGGMHSFFGENTVILDIGSGFGKAAEQMAAKARKRLGGPRIVALDVDYNINCPERRKGVNFVSADWKELSFSSGTFTGYLGMESFPRYESGQKSVEKTIGEMTRTAKPGAIWRATMPLQLNEIMAFLGGQNIVEDNRSNYILETLIKNGWEVYLSNKTFIAKLTNEKPRPSSS